MTERLKKELQLLRRYYPQTEWLDHGAGGWGRIPDFPLPSGVWNRDTTTVCFEVSPGYPGAAPYGFYVEAGLQIKTSGTRPNNYEEPVSIPFPGSWGKFSWAHDGTWRPTSDLLSGSNLLNFVETFKDRLREGA
jgi:hypothetical protein